jgi:phage shock protein E
MRYMKKLGERVGFKNLQIVLILILSILVSTLAACAPAAEVAAPEIISTRIDAEAYNRSIKDEVEHLLVDVRTPEEFAAGYIPGAVNISLQSLPNRISEIPKGLAIVVYCRSGNRSASATEILVNAGFRPVYDLGGIQDWISAGNAVEY